MLFRYFLRFSLSIAHVGMKLVESLPMDDFQSFHRWIFELRRKNHWSVTFPHILIPFNNLRKNSEPKSKYLENEPFFGAMITLMKKIKTSI
jgi:hypothetical protein